MTQYFLVQMPLIQFIVHFRFHKKKKLELYLCCLLLITEVLSGSFNQWDMSAQDLCKRSSQKTGVMARTHRLEGPCVVFTISLKYDCDSKNTQGSS